MQANVPVVCRGPSDAMVCASRCQRRRVRILAASALALMLHVTAAQAITVRDEVFGDNFEPFDTTTCDSGLASNSTTPADYAAALDMCQTATEVDRNPGLISATLTLADKTGTPAAASHSIRTAFGTNVIPPFGAAMVVLATGAAASQGQTNPSFTAPQPGADNGTSGPAPPDWLSANGGTFPSAPGCPPASGSTVFDPVMLKLRIRVPNNARSFTLDANFYSSDFPEYVCSATNDMFVALLDSAYTGVPANPADKNLAVYVAPSLAKYPLGVNLAQDNTGLFTQCVNGVIGCNNFTSSSISTCTSTSDLTGTGMDVADGVCYAGSMVGGATGWLSISGNVLPGETIELRLGIWDSVDHSYDSLILLDHLRWSHATVTPGVALH